MARASLCLIAFALCALAQVYCASTGSTPDINALLQEIKTSIDKTIADSKKSLNLPENPDGAAIVKALREQVDRADKGFNDMKTKLDESIKKNPELSGAIDSFKAKLEEAREKIKKENPEVAANAQKVADNLKSAYDSVVKETEKFNSEVNKKGGIREDFDNLMKNFIDRGTASAKDFQKKVEEAIKEMTGKKA